MNQEENKRSDFDFIQELVNRANRSQAAFGMDWTISVIGMGDNFVSVRGMDTDEPEEEAIKEAIYALVRFAGNLSVGDQNLNGKIALMSIEFLKESGPNWAANPGTEAQIVSRRTHVEADPNAFWAILYSGYNEGAVHGS